MQTENVNRGGKSPKEVREMFARVARRYDFLNHALSLRRDVYWRKTAAQEALGLQAGDAIADLCCGTGDLALALKQTAPAARIVGLDFTPEMVSIATAKAQRLKAPAPPSQGSALLFALGDSLALPLADNSVALAAVAFGIRNVADLQRGLSEMIRVVRPGGKVVVLEFTTPRGYLFGPLYLFYFRCILPLLGRLISTASADAYHYLPRSVAAFADAAEMSSLMQSLKLTQVRATPLTFGVAHLYVGVKP